MPEIKWVRSDKRVDILDEVEGLVRAYVAIWGSVDQLDSYGTWFDRTRPPEMDLDLLPIALRYEHGMDGQITYERIGEIVEIGFDDEGIFFLAHLDKSSPFFERVVAEIKDGTPEGALRTSSGTLGYLAEFFEDGAFKIWPVAEVSLTSMPAESRMPDVELLRSERPLADEESVNGTKRGDEPEPNKPITDKTENREMNILEILGSVPEGATPEETLQNMFAALIAEGIALEDIEAVLASMTSPEAPAPDATPEEAAASERSSFVAEFSKLLQAKMDVQQTEEVTEESRNMRSDNARLQRENSLYRAQINAPPKQPAPRGDLTGGGNITDVRDMRFDHLGAKEMVFGAELANARKTQLGSTYVRAMNTKVSDLVERGASGFKQKRNFNSIRSAFPYRADEIMNTDFTGGGLEWVPTIWSSMLWETAQVSTIFDALLGAGMMQLEIPEGDSIWVPLEGADPTLYSAAENTSVNAQGVPGTLVDPSIVGTSRVSVTPKKAMAVTYVSTEQIEDSIIPMLPQITKQTERAFVHGLEYLLLSGDTETAANTNINLIDGTPATGTGAPLYLVSDSALKYSLVTGPAASLTTSRDGGTLSSGDFLATRKLLPNANAALPNNLIFVSDVSTNLKSLEMLDVKTDDVFPGATIVNGVLQAIWGTPYMVSGQMGLANSAGKISATAGNNTLGRILCLYAEYWAWVMKRAVRTSVTEDAKSDTTEIVSSMRVAFKARGAGASTVSYNLIV